MVQTQPSGTKQSEFDQFFAPKLTRTGLTIRISLSVIEDIGFAMIEGLKAVPKRGLEIGGILLGQLDAAQSTILIEAYETVESEHLYGPSWLLSPKDRSAFRRTLDRLRSGGSQQLRPVGFFRSQTRNGLGFDDQDNALMREMFASEPALCMLVKPSIAEPGKAQFGMMTDNLLQPVAFFPFHAAVLREGDFQIFEASSPGIEDSSSTIEALPPVIENSPPVIEESTSAIEESTPVIEESTPVIEESTPVIEESTPVIEESTPVIEESTPVMIPVATPPPPHPVSAHSPPERERIPPPPVSAPEPEERRRIPSTATLVAIAAVILVCAFLVARYRTPRASESVQPVTTAAPPTLAAPPPVASPPPIAAPPPVKPAVEQPPVLNNAVLLNVQRENGTAVLTWNHDAPTVKGADYALLRIEDGRNREQLHLNKTELDTGRLVYIPRSRDVSFHLQLFAQSHSTTESIRSAADLPATPPSDSHRNSRSLSTAAKLPRADRPEPAPTPEPPAYHAPETTAAAPPTISQAPAQASTPPAVAQPAPPPEATAELTAPKPTPFAEPDKTPPKPREPEIVTTVSLELIGHSGVREVLDTLSPRHIFGGGDKSTPPRIVRQILPGIYPALAPRIHGTRQVDVKITIGPGGQVIRTEFPDGHAADPIDSVVYYAARQWTFEPARVGNRPVESKVLMHFVLKHSS